MLSKWKALSHIFRSMILKYVVRIKWSMRSISWRYWLLICSAWLTLTLLNDCGQFVFSMQLMQRYFKTVINFLSQISNPLAFLPLMWIPEIFSNKILVRNKSTTIVIIFHKFSIVMLIAIVIALIFIQIFLTSLNNFINSFH